MFLVERIDFFSSSFVYDTLTVSDMKSGDSLCQYRGKRRARTSYSFPYRSQLVEEIICDVLTTLAVKGQVKVKVKVTRIVVDWNKLNDSIVCADS